MEELCSALNCCTLDHLVAQMVENNPETTNIIDDIIEYSGAIEWGKLIGDINSQEDLIQLLDSIQAGLENKIEATTNAIFRYKGNVETVDNLPSENNEQGDVYNVNETGANYCWNGQTWDKLSETHDLSVFLTIESFKNQIVNYYTKAEVDAIIESINKVIADINQKISEMTELAAADKAELKSIIDTKADASKVETDLNDVKTSLESTKTEIKADLETKADKAKFEALAAVAVPYKEFTYNDQVRKTIQLDNYDSISGIASDGSGHNLAMLSKWDVADFGATGIHCNLNTSQIVTVNDTQAVITDALMERIVLAGSNIAIDKKELTDEATGFKFNAYEVSSDLSTLATKDEVKGGLADANASVAAVISRLDILEDKISNLKKTNIEAQAITSDAGELNVSNPDVDYVVSGEVAAKTVVEGKSVTLKDSSINSAVITLKASEDVDIKATNIEGTFDKATMGNAVGIVKSDGYVSIKDCTITPDKAYNGIEILGTPKNVLIDNVKFEGKFDNNAISIYATADDAIVTISNCHFNDVSNILRISNKNGGKATYNIINCVCDNWEANPEFSGAVICQDYTSKSAEAEIENALFKNVKINIQNLTIPGNVKLEKPEDVSTILGSGEGQVLYVYGDQNGLFAYNPDIYPTVNIQ